MPDKNDAIIKSILKRAANAKGFGSGKEGMYMAKLIADGPYTPPPRRKGPPPADLDFGAPLPTQRKAD